MISKCQALCWHHFILLLTEYHFGATIIINNLVGFAILVLEKETETWESKSTSSLKHQLVNPKFSSLKSPRLSQKSERPRLRVKFQMDKSLTVNPEHHHTSRLSHLRPVTKTFLVSTDICSLGILLVLMLHSVLIGVNRINTSKALKSVFAHNILHDHKCQLL